MNSFKNKIGKLIEVTAPLRVITTVSISPKQKDSSRVLKESTVKRD